jgi:hypothetical protein
VKKWMGGTLDTWMNERKESQKGRCLDGRTDGRTDRWMGGWIDIHIHRIPLQSCCVGVEEFLRKTYPRFTVVMSRMLFRAKLID